MKNIRLTKWQLFAALGMLFVFTLDFFLQLGLSVSLLYLACFFLLIRETKKTILLFLGFTILLIALDLAIVYKVDIGWREYADVGMSILSVIIGAYMSIRYRTLLDKTNAEREGYIRSLEEMLFMTSHKVRKPVATCMGLMTIIDMKNPSKEDIETIFSHIKISATELDTFTKELTAFMHDIQLKHRADQAAIAK